MFKQVNCFIHFAAVLLALSFTPNLFAADSGGLPENQNISLVHSISFAKCVDGYRLDDSKTQKISEVMTADGIYQVDSKFQPSLLISRESGNAESQNCSAPDTTFSPGGEIAVASIFVAHETFNTYLIDLVKKTKSLMKDSGGAFFSSKSFLLLNVVSGTRDLFDFSGAIIRSFGGAESFICAKAHKNGFVGFDPGFHFINSSGKYLKHLPYQSYGLNYDVDFETGITAILVPFPSSSKPREESMIYIHDYQGNLLTQFSIPFADTVNGIGLSPGGDYVAVLSKLGWVKLFDIKNNKQLWTRDFNWGHLFASWCSPIPISSDGKFVIVHGDTWENRKDRNLFLVFDRSGNTVGHINCPVPREYALKCRIVFIPETSQFILISDNTISQYEIKRSE